jgi:predicted anti-sigma-YlaC factor YlaD
VHERFTSLMSLVLDGAATPIERQELDEHLDVCSICAATWHQWQAVDRILSTVATVAPSHSLAGAVLQNLPARELNQSTSGWLTLGLLTACVLCLTTSCLATATLLWWAWQHPLAVAMMLSAGAQILSWASWILEELETVISSARGYGLSVLLADLMLCHGLILLGVWARSRTRSASGGAGSAMTPG